MKFQCHPQSHFKVQFFKNSSSNLYLNRQNCKRSFVKTFSFQNHYFTVLIINYLTIENLFIIIFKYFSFK